MRCTVRKRAWQTKTLQIIVNKACSNDDFLDSQTSGAHGAQVTPIAPSTNRCRSQILLAHIAVAVSSTARCPLAVARADSCTAATNQPIERDLSNIICARKWQLRIALVFSDWVEWKQGRMGDLCTGGARS